MTTGSNPVLTTMSKRYSEVFNPRLFNNGLGNELDILKAVFPWVKDR